MSVVTFDWVALAPVLAPALGALLVLLVDALAPNVRRPHLGLGVLALVAGLATAVPGALGRAGDPVLTLCLPAPDGACLYDASPTSSALQLGALGASLVVLLLLWPRRGHLSTVKGGPAVVVTLLLVATSGATMVAAARDLGTWLIALELATLPVIALVTLRGDTRSGAGALSLLTTSLVSFALLVVGVALWVVATGDVAFGAEGVRRAAEQPETRAVLVLAAVFLVSGLGFKLSLVPFHTWTPQAYTASDEAVAALLATTSKVAALAAAVVVLRPLSVLAGPDGVATEGSHDLALVAVVALLAAVTMTVGNVVALRQDDPVRLLAWSTVAQAGWVVLPLSAFTPGAADAAAGYLLAYVVATAVAFAAVVAVRAEGSPRTLTAYRGLLRERPWLGGALGLALLSLAGLPPGIIGLVAKVVALRPVVDAELWWLAVIAVLNAVIGIAVYLRWVAVLFADPDEVPGPSRAAAATKGALVLATTALVATSVMPQALLGLLG